MNEPIYLCNVVLSALFDLLGPNPAFPVSLIVFDLKQLSAWLPLKAKPTPQGFMSITEFITLIHAIDTTSDRIVKEESERILSQS